ncbi:MAG: hypothetical protein NW201_14160 [Gemmatimonadales bacterium]|nr:hypothetical protein [Gemmatimonadales bacterium]
MFRKPSYAPGSIVRCPFTGRTFQANARGELEPVPAAPALSTDEGEEEGDALGLFGRTAELVTALRAT